MENTSAGVTLTLDPDKQDNAAGILGAAPQMETVSTPFAGPGEFSAGATDESMLSPEEMKQVEQFAGEIDISDVDQVVKYGAAAQRNISDFSVSILKKVKTLDLGEVGDSLKELTLALDATTEPEKHGIAKLFQKAKRGIATITTDYAKAETNVTKVEKDLQKHQVVLTQDISMYQQLYDLNI